MSGNRSQGFTLVEIALAITVLVIVLYAGSTAVTSGQGTFDRTVASSAVNTRAHRALNEIARALTGAGRGQLTPSPDLPFGSDSLRFPVVVGWSDLAPTWSSDFMIALEYEPGEVDNGLDDDSDGLVDECQIVFTRNVDQANEVSTVIASGVAEFLEGELPGGGDENGNGLEDERGLSFQLEGDAIVVRLTVIHAEADGTIAMRTLDTRVALRN